MKWVKCKIIICRDQLKSSLYDRHHEILHYSGIFLQFCRATWINVVLISICFRSNGNHKRYCRHGWTNRSPTNSDCHHSRRSYVCAGWRHSYRSPFTRSYQGQICRGYFSGWSISQGKKLFTRLFPSIFVCSGNLFFKFFFQFFSMHQPMEQLKLFYLIFVEFIEIVREKRRHRLDWKGRWTVARILLARWLGAWYNRNSDVVRYLHMGLQKWW